MTIKAGLITSSCIDP